MIKKHHTITSIILLFILLVVSIGCSFQLKTTSATTTKDVTNQLILLGNPFKKKTYANNVWDIQVYNNRIYLGHGDMGENAGPIPVIYYDPTINNFITQFTVDEEQIDVYKVLNQKLYIPGSDSSESWSLGNFYVMENDKWIKYRTIPHGVHVNDLAYFNDRLYVATASAKTGWGEVLMSKDMGKTWISQVPQNKNFILINDWAASFLEFNNKLCAVGTIVIPSSPRTVSYYSKYQNLVVIDNNGSTIQSYDQSIMPGAKKDRHYTVKRQIRINNKLVYLSGIFLGSKDLWAPEALYIADDINSTRRINLTVDNVIVIPTDILSRGNTAYVLTYIKNSENSFTNIVYQSNDLEKWTELFRFNTDTFARSFEELNGDFYFGLGCTRDVSPDSTGNILKFSFSN